jgi:hypothetical protein
MGKVKKTVTVCGIFKKSTYDEFGAGAVEDKALSP